MHRGGSIWERRHALNIFSLVASGSSRCPPPKRLGRLKQQAPVRIHTLPQQRREPARDGPHKGINSPRGKGVVEGDGKRVGLDGVVGEIGDLETGGGLGAREGDVALARGEAAVEVDPDAVDGVALALVDGEGPRELERDLDAAAVAGHVDAVPELGGAAEQFGVVAEADDGVVGGGCGVADELELGADGRARRVVGAKQLDARDEAVSGLLFGNELCDDSPAAVDEAFVGKVFGEHDLRPF